MATDRLGDVLTRLRIKGVHLALDDFGTGYSSLLLLLRMPFSELKLDQSFVQRCDQDAYAWKIVRATISLARGVRDDGPSPKASRRRAWRRCCDDARCDMAQGFFLRGRCRSRLRDPLDGAAASESGSEPSGPPNGIAGRIPRPSLVWSAFRQDDHTR